MLSAGVHAPRDLDGQLQDLRNRCIAVTDAFVEGGRQRPRVRQVQLARVCSGAPCDVGDLACSGIHQSKLLQFAKYLGKRFRRDPSQYEILADRYPNASIGISPGDLGYGTKS